MQPDQSADAKNTQPVLLIQNRVGVFIARYPFGPFSCTPPPKSFPDDR